MQGICETICLIFASLFKTYALYPHGNAFPYLVISNTVVFLGKGRFRFHGLRKHTCIVNTCVAMSISWNSKLMKLDLRGFNFFRHNSECNKFRTKGAGFKGILTFAIPHQWGPTKVNKKTCGRSTHHEVRSMRSITKLIHLNWLSQWEWHVM
jgi:hypothetical protein